MNNVTFNMNKVTDQDAVLDTSDPDLNLELEQLKLEHLKLQEAQLLCKQRLLIKQAQKKSIKSSTTKKSLLTDGRVITRNVNNADRNGDTDDHGSQDISSVDLNETNTICSCKANRRNSWNDATSSDKGSSTPSTCVMCTKDSSKIQTNMLNFEDKSELVNKYRNLSKGNISVGVSVSKIADVSKISFISKSSNVTNKYTEATSKEKVGIEKKLDNIAGKIVEETLSEITCDLKYSDYNDDSDDNEYDNTNRLIQLRNSDYLDIVENTLKVVIALTGYPNCKMSLRHMEQFQKCLADIMDMQLKENLLKRLPSFLDYYLSRGAIVCICKDLHTRDWIVRICAGLQDRMGSNLILLKAKVKRFFTAKMKIPLTSWPSTAQDTFKLLQYFNPLLKTELWKIYSQEVTNKVEYTSFLVDKVSGELIRGPSFKNVIDYSQMDFELNGPMEIYYECFISGSNEDVSSAASRIRLLEELRRKEFSASNRSDFRSPNLDSPSPRKQLSKEMIIEDNNLNKANDMENMSVGVLSNITNNNSISKNNGIFSDENSNNNDIVKENFCDKITSDNIVSDKTESLFESMENMTISRNSNLNIDTARGVAYFRRTNYLHVDNELKIAITLEGYPDNKLEGAHIRRLKHLFKEYLHKDVKQQHFTNLIIPKFQDVYLSNGAVIYICDSLASKDYLNYILPKFIKSTGLKLIFKDIKSLVRYTRVIMRLSKEQAHMESVEILRTLQTKYPKLKPDCWKYYTDVAGKQKRQFGVDPESLEVIKSINFNPVYEGENINFRIIDRQKRNVSSGDCKSNSDVLHKFQKKIRDNVIKNMYIPIETMSLTKTRIAHYADVVADDLKLYVGPANYPESRIDDALFCSIKTTLENIVCESLEKGDAAFEKIPRFHDFYLCDGVIFVICQNISSKFWIEQVLLSVNYELSTNLKCTEFRGAVGIVTMSIKTKKECKDVIDILQNQNPRLRCKFWRIISVARNKNKMQVVMQIDKLSAQVITDKKFDKFIEGNPVQFKLGHLQSLLKRKANLEKLSETSMKVPDFDQDLKVEGEIKIQSKNEDPLASIPAGLCISNNESQSLPLLETLDSRDLHNTFKNPQDYAPALKDVRPNVPPVKTLTPLKKSDIGTVLMKAMLSERNSEPIVANNNEPSYCKMLLKIPSQLIPDNKDNINILFKLLKDKNPHLNTELWKVATDSAYQSGKIPLIVDENSAAVIQSKDFDSTIVGRQLKFYM